MLFSEVFRADPDGDDGVGLAGEVDRQGFGLACKISWQCGRLGRRASKAKCG
jgi:hypothetical protein